MLSWELQHSITTVFLGITCSNQGAELGGRITTLGSNWVKYVSLAVLIVTWLQYDVSKSPFHIMLDGHKQIPNKTYSVSSKLFLELIFNNNCEPRKGNQIITSFRIIKNNHLERSEFTLILVQTICAYNNKFLHSCIYSCGFTGIQDHPLFIYLLALMSSFNTSMYTPQCSK